MKRFKRAFILLLAIIMIMPILFLNSTNVVAIEIREEVSSEIRGVVPCSNCKYSSAILYCFGYWNVTGPHTCFYLDVCFRTVHQYYTGLNCPKCGFMQPKFYYHSEMKFHAVCGRFEVDCPY